MPLVLLQQCRRTWTAQDFVTLVIEPTVSHLSKIPFQIAAPQLMLGIALHESGGLKHRRQIGGGPALGLFQMETRTHNDIWNNFLRYRTDLADQVRALRALDGSPRASEMISDDIYAAAMCRVHIYRYSPNLPGRGEIKAQAKIWKQHYNTVLGAGTIDKYVADWNTYGGPKVSFRNYCS
ncbi:hypothetical protein [Litoreibacter halocynthiae]|uniref:hypothetical protein n=1 Tax=Litoreibacter halocynthiae TaxID=1242689 RepID=UPI00248FE473|nr:hypothetical protein [Litoreibacter halocynthiae]